MKYKFSIKSLKISYSNLLLLVLGFFFITKMLRAFSGSTTQGGVWVIIQLLLMAIGFILVLKKVKTVFSNAAIIFMFLYALLSLLNSLFSVDSAVLSIYSYIMIPYALSILVIFYVNGSKINVENNIILTVTFYIISTIFIFFMLRSGNYSTEIGSVSDSYYVIGLLPVVLVYSRKCPLLPIFVTGFVIIISGKRAGLLAFAFMIIAYYLVEVLRTRKYKSLGISFVSLIAVIVLIYILFIIINQYFNSSLLSRFLRIWEDGGSGRNERWRDILTGFHDSSILKMIFGHGVESVVRDFGGYAHNDFLELLYNYGIFPVLCYIFFYIALIFEFFKMLKKRYEYSAQFLMTIIFSLMMAMFSFYVFVPTYITAGMICKGLIMADFNKKSK